MPDQLGGVKDHQRQADPIAQSGHPGVERPRPLGREHPQLHEPHSQEHPSTCEEKPSQQESNRLDHQHVEGAVLDNPQVAAPVGRHLLVPVLQLLLGVGLEFLLQTVGPDVVDPLIELAWGLAGLDLGIDPRRDGLHALDRRIKPKYQGHDQHHQRHAQNDQRSGRLVAEQVEKQTAFRVVRKGCLRPRSGRRESRRSRAARRSGDSKPRGAKPHATRPVRS